MAGMGIWKDDPQSGVGDKRAINNAQENVNQRELDSKPRSTMLLYKEDDKPQPVQFAQPMYQAPAPVNVAPPTLDPISSGQPNGR